MDKAKENAVKETDKSMILLNDYESEISYKLKTQKSDQVKNAKLPPLPKV